MAYGWIHLARNQGNAHWTPSFCLQWIRRSLCLILHGCKISIFVSPLLSFWYHLHHKWSSLELESRAPCQWRCSGLHAMCWLQIIQVHMPDLPPFLFILSAHWLCGAPDGGESWQGNYDNLGLRQPRFLERTSQLSQTVRTGAETVTARPWGWAHCDKSIHHRPLIPQILPGGQALDKNQPTTWFSSVGPWQTSVNLSLSNKSAKHPAWSPRLIWLLLSPAVTINWRGWLLIMPLIREVRKTETANFPWRRPAQTVRSVWTIPASL